MGLHQRRFGQARRTAVIAVLLVTVTSAVMMALPAAAQQNDSARSFDIPAEALPDAILQFGQQASVQISGDSVLTRGKTTHGIKGAFAPPEALARLLEGTGLTFRFSSPASVQLEPTPNSSGAIQLSPVQVEGQQGTNDGQSAYGPGVGYVATRSATGTKSDTPLIEVPQTVSVVTQQQIEDQQPLDLNEALRYTAGIVPERLGVAPINTQQNLLLRGFAPQIYVDGLIGYDGLQSITPYLLDRIEVLNGPASVLYGQESPGGLVNMESKRPTDVPLHEVELGMGNDARYQGAFDFGGPIDDDGTFLYRLTGIGFTENSQVDYNKSQELAIAPALTWRPDADTSLTLFGKYISDPARGAYSYVDAYGSVLPNPNGKIPVNFFYGDPNFNKQTQTMESVGYDFEHRFDDTWSFRQNLRYENVHGLSDSLYVEDLEPDMRTLDRWAWQDQSGDQAFDVDSQVGAKFQTGALTHDVTLGLDYRRLNDTYGLIFDYSGDIPPIDMFAPVYHVAPTQIPGTLSESGSTQDQIGLYAQDQISYDHWRFVLGARGDYAKEPGSYLSRAPTWRAGVVYVFDNGLAPYFSYSTSFTPNTGFYFDGAPLQPTTAQQYEAGIKYQPLGWNSFVTASLYNLTEQDVVTADPNHPNCNCSVQIGAERAQGLEVEGHASLTDSLSLIANYSYTDAIDSKDSSADTDTGINGIVEPLQGKFIEAVPTHMASIWADYAFHDGEARGLGLSAGLRYIGPSFGDDVNSFKVPGFAVLDAAMHYDLARLDPALSGARFQLNVANLLDKTYVSSCDSDFICYYGARRTVYASLRYDW